MKLNISVLVFLILGLNSCIKTQKKDNFPIILQQNVMECGPICLQMIATHYGNKVDLQKLILLTKMDDTGTSLLSLSQVDSSAASLFSSVARSILIVKLLDRAIILHSTIND